jgi:hypothetical protein
MSNACRSHLSYLNWKVTVPTTAEECGQKVLGPICLNGNYPESPDADHLTNNGIVVCNTSSIPAKSQWPLVSITDDPTLKSAVVPTTVCGKYVPNAQR